MSKLGAVGATFVTLFALITSCSGDEKRVAHDSDAGAAGEAGAGSGPGGTGSGGSSNDPAGAGGVPTSAAGAAGESASGGAGAGTGGALDAGGIGGSGDAGGAAIAGAGGAADCPATPVSEEHSCGLVVELWLPTYTTVDRTIHFDVSQLQPPIVSGTIRVQFAGVDGGDCQELPVRVSAGEATAVLPTEVVPAAIQLDIFTFTLVDECGGTHTYDPIGVACYTLSGAGGAGTWDLSCDTRSFPCPGQCG